MADDEVQTFSAPDQDDPEFSAGKPCAEETKSAAEKLESLTIGDGGGRAAGCGGRS